MKGTVAEIIKIQSLGKETAQAAVQQPRSVEDGVSVVTQIEQTTEQNAAMVAQSLAAENEILSDLLDYFARAKDAPGEHAQLATLGALATARLRRLP